MLKTYAITLQGIKSSACRNKLNFLVFFFFLGNNFHFMFPHATRFTDHAPCWHANTGALVSCCTDSHREGERERVRKKERESCRASDALPSSSNMEVGKQVSANLSQLLFHCRICYAFSAVLLLLLGKYFANFLNI